MRLIIYDNVRYLLTSSTEEAVGEFHRQLPSIKADIVGMRATQLVDQKSYHRMGNWDIKEHFGITAVLYHSKVDKLKRKQVIENLRKTTTEYPVPVYDLVSGSKLARFWVGLSDEWDSPTLSQEVDPITADRHNTDFEITTYGGRTVFPLVRVGEPYWRKFPDDDDRSYWSDEEYVSSSSSPDTTWTPGETVDEENTNWPWLSDAWHGTASPVDFQNWGTSAVLKACDETGEILKSNDLAHLEDLLTGLSSIRTGDSFPLYHVYNRSDYMYSWETTYGYIITEMSYYGFGQCPFVVSNTTVITGTEVHEMVSQSGYRVRSNISSNTITLNGNSIAAGSGGYTETVVFSWVPLAISGDVVRATSNSDPYLLEDAAVVGVKDWEDYSAWCVLYLYHIENNTCSFTAVNTTDGVWTDEYYDARNSCTYPGVFTVSAKIADCPDEFILFQGSYSDENNDYWAYSEHVEIYDFHKKPVYIFTVTIYKYIENVAVNIYAMIYNGVLYKSEEFETDSIDNENATIYESVSNWGLKGAWWARAVGVRVTSEAIDEFTIEE